MDQRYSRQAHLPGFGEEGQQNLQAAKVLVVGAGGLGVPVLQYLTGMGVGTLGMVDGDKVSLSNLHRQVLYTTPDIGEYKVTVAVRRLSMLNPEVHLVPYAYHLSPENALALIQNYDLVVDATDNFEARYLINDACVLLKKPFVYGALHQFEGQVSVFNHLGGPTYRCLYPTPPTAQEIPDCNTAGVLGVVPGLLGMYQALEAIKVVTGIGTSSAGWLMLFDFLDNTQYKVKLKVRPENQTIHALQPSYAREVCANVPEMTVRQVFDWFSQGTRFLLLDVREEWEYQQAHLQKALLTPLHLLPSQVAQLPRHLPIITVCQKGARSRKAAQLLQEQDASLQVYSMAGGMDQWLKELSHTLVVK